MSSNKKNFFKTIFKSNGSSCGGCGNPKSTEVYQPIPKHSSTHLSQNTIVMSSFRTTSSSSSPTSSSGVEIINIRKSTTFDKEESNTSVSTSTSTLTSESDQPTHHSHPKQVNKPKIVINLSQNAIVNVGKNSPSSTSSSLVSLSGLKVKNGKSSDIDNEGSNISVSTSTSTSASASASASAHYSESDQACFHVNQKLQTKDMKIINSIAVEKESDDPYQDFRESMLQMITEKEIYSKDELEELLQCFLEINSPSHHEVIVRAFMEIWDKITVRSGSGFTGTVCPSCS